MQLTEQHGKIIGNWGQDDGIGEMTRVAGETDLWEIKIIPIAYYYTTSEEDIYKLGTSFSNVDSLKAGMGLRNSMIFFDVDQSTSLSGSYHES